MVTLLPTKHAVRAAARGEEDRAKAGIAVNKVTRHTMAFAAANPISVFSELDIIDPAPIRAAKLKIVSLVIPARGSVHTARLRS